MDADYFNIILFLMLRILTCLGFILMLPNFLYSHQISVTLSIPRKFSTCDQESAEVTHSKNLGYSSSLSLITFRNFSNYMII